MKKLRPVRNRNQVHVMSKNNVCELCTFSILIKYQKLKKKMQIRCYYGKLTYFKET